MCCVNCVYLLSTLETQRCGQHEHNDLNKLDYHVSLMLHIKQIEVSITATGRHFVGVHCMASLKPGLRTAGTQQDVIALPCRRFNAFYQLLTFSLLIYIYIYTGGGHL
jgi:hypothetical protein